MKSPYDILREIPGGIPKPTATILQASWRGVVGDDLADHSEVVDVERGVVTIASTPPWSRAIFEVREQIVKSLNRDTPWRFKSIVIEEHPAPPVRAESAPEAEKTPEPTDRMKRAIEELDDPALAGFASRILKNILDER